MRKVELMEHNKETYDKVKKAWETSNKTAVIQPTGTGKSYIIAKVVEDNKKKEILILSPSDLINEQMSKILGKELSNVQFMNYPTLMNYEKELKKDIIVLDEFHRCGAEKWGLGVNRLLQNNVNSKVLGTTATPIRFLDNERDMSDELFEGNVANIIRLSEAIVRGILPMPMYVTALYTLGEEMNKMLDKIEKSKNTEEEKEEYRKELNKARNNLDKSFGIPAILKKYINFDNGKMIVFCKDNAHQKEMIEVVEDWFKIINKKTVSYVVYSHNGDEANNNEIEEFKTDSNEGIKLLFTINMFNEGLHLKDVDGVMLLRPTTSPIIFYQQIGRAIDAGSKKNPLILDLVANVDNLYCGNFKQEMEETYESLRDSGRTDLKEIELDFFIKDETVDVLETFNKLEYKLINKFEYMFNLLCEYKEEKGNCNIPKEDRYKGEKLGIWLWYMRACKRKGTLNVELENKLSKMGVIWEFYNDFDYYIDLLKEHKNEYGTCHVFQGHKYKGVNLGMWSQDTRKKRKLGKLSEQEIKKLDEIGFVWKPSRDKFYENFELLCDYMEINGDCNIPSKSIYKGVKLGSWTTDMRKNNKKGILSKEKIDKLNSIGFIWDILTDNFETNFEELVKYEEENGDCDVNHAYVVNEIKLGRWVMTLRRTKRLGDMTKEREERLNKIGFIWEKEKDVKFNERYNLLCEYVKEKGHCIVKIDEKYRGIKLGYWLSKQKERRNSGKLEKNKEEKLNKLGVVWNYLSKIFEDNVECLKQYKEEFGNCNVPQGYVYKGVSLGNWIRTMRTEKNMGRLGNDRVDLLNKLGFIWSTKDKILEDRINILKEYIDETGSNYVHFKCIYKNFNLGNWIYRLKISKKEEKLDGEIEKRLNDLGIDLN